MLFCRTSWSVVTLVPQQIELFSSANKDTPNQKKPVKARTDTKSGPNSRRPPSSLFFVSVNSSMKKAAAHPQVFLSANFKSECSCFGSKASVNLAGQLQSRLIFRVTGSGGGGGLALLVEFQEAGFLCRHGDSHVIAVGIFQRGQGLFL